MLRISLPQSSRIAVLIACHNRCEKTIRCLDRLHRSYVPPNTSVEIFLVDDGSIDGTADQVRDLFPAVHLLSGDGTLYWSGGMRVAWMAACKGNYDYYLWLNDDAFLFEDAIADLLKSAYETGSNAIICSTFLSKSSGNVTYGGKMRHAPMFHIPNGVLTECEIITGNCVLVPKSVFERLGFLDSHFSHAIGDFDYGLRAVKAGIKCFVAPTAAGYCEPNPLPPKWCQEDAPFPERLRSLYSPLGYSQPKPYFIYVARHFGISQAIRHIISMHIRVVFPQLWRYLKTRGAG